MSYSFAFPSRRLPCTSGEGDTAVCNYVSNKAWIWSTCRRVNPLSNPALLTTKETSAHWLWLWWCSRVTAAFYGDISVSGIMPWNYSISLKQWHVLLVYDNWQKSRMSHMSRQRWMNRKRNKTNMIYTVYTVCVYDMCSTTLMDWWPAKVPFHPVSIHGNPECFRIKRINYFSR